ncbi:polysaccharide biosynthesis protein [Neptunomonas concharum]|uniref:Polysaccharide biosynthesis protein n=1 Tax=Neptunomonas concharum TaxID=1031538 RepID=A0A5P1R8D3_9GAMM|nr:nucleoside-diphosphate sugar epimerase/dehydratase [Neptunomonas concharum]QEQ95858.1 polysaccharide biosynthesis protein [Neptunomonas concharum]
MLTYILQLPRAAKRLISLAADVILLSVAFWGGYWVRLDHLTPIDGREQWLLLAAVIPVTLFVFIRIGLYRAVLRFVSFRVLWTVALGVFLSTLFLVLAAFYFNTFLPRSVPVIYFAFSLILVGGVRLFFRMVYQNTRGSRIPVVIYGAGPAGRQLHQALNQGAEYFAVGYVEDNPRVIGSFIQGLEVFNAEALEGLIAQHEVKKVFLAVPESNEVDRQRILKRLESVSCEVLSIPSVVDLIEGNAKIDELKEVSIDDLLGREPVSPIVQLMEADIANKVVLVSGAGGSIGSELCRQIVRSQPATLVLFELSEFALYQIEKELRQIIEHDQLHIILVPLLGTVQNEQQLYKVFKDYAVQTVYHAAAYKHVPLVEANVIEGVRNNVFGTLSCAQAAILAQVETFVLISTDKAVRPANVMGATKRLAELILQALAREQSVTRFAIVRFGNVLGSSGSVVPLFRQQIKQGGPVTVTHEDVVRYFMTIPEAAQLVIQAGAMGRGGDVYVLDMGKPVKIMELARRMIRLSGLTPKEPETPNGDMEIKVTGLRPGEKLYEELWLGEHLRGTEHARIMSADEVYVEWPVLSILLARLREACDESNDAAIIEIFLSAALNFHPANEAFSQAKIAS